MSFLYDKENNLRVANTAFFSILLIIIVIGALFGISAVSRLYDIWSLEMKGKADLAEAKWNKQIMVEEAAANLESEKLNALAEIERAKGMAEAIKIEGGQLSPEYIQYLWVRSNNFNEATTIYIPTETNLPILEANRLK